MFAPTTILPTGSVTVPRTEVVACPRAGLPCNKSTKARPKRIKKRCDDARIEDAARQAPVTFTHITPPLPQRRYLIETLLKSCKAYTSIGGLSRRMLDSPSLPSVDWTPS